MGHHLELSRMFLGDWTSGKSHVPVHWVSWEGGGLDYAALVLEATQNSGVVTST